MASPRWVLALSAWMAAGPAAGQTAISYSPPENAYGWCVEFAGPRAAAACAQDWCADSGGSDCRVVLTCRGGWGAVAFAEAPLAGLTAICGTTTQDSAQILALATCAAANNTMCWTSAVFDGAGTARPAARNEDFDRTFYSQILLQLNRFPLGPSTGFMDQATRDAIMAFQRKLGVRADGTTEVPLIFNLVAAAGGRQVLIDALREKIAEPYAQEYAPFLFTAAPTPIPPRSFADDLAALSEIDRADAMRSLLMASDIACSDPVVVALPPEGFGDMVTATCAGQGYLVVVEDGVQMISKQ